MDRETAQARLNRIRSFNSELDALEQAAIVTLDESQRRAIAAYHQRLLDDLTAQFDLDRDEGQQRMSLGMQIASILGAIALSAAVFLFFYQIWGRLSTTVQVTLLAGAPLVAVVATEIAHRLDRTRHFVFVAAVIACACIVMNVALVGEIFAMTDSPKSHPAGGDPRLGQRRSPNQPVGRPDRECDVRAADGDAHRASRIQGSPAEGGRVHLGLAAARAAVCRHPRGRPSLRAMDRHDRTV